MSPIASTKEATQRIPALDAAKGFAICLVVFGHVLGGTISRAWVSPSGPAELIYDYLYAFHMPLFFLLSGAFALDGIRTDPVGALWSKIGSIAWPYFLWGVLHITMEPVMSHYMLAPPGGPLSEVRRLLLGETSWFLWTLFLVNCLAALCLRILPISWFLIGSVALYVFLFDKEIGNIGLVVRFLPFFLIGGLLGPRIKTDWGMSRSALVCLGAACFGVLYILVSYGATKTAVGFLCGGLLGSAASLAWAWCYRGGVVGRSFATIGFASLVVFLLHPYFQGAAREVIFHVLGSTWWLQLLAATAAGIAGPTLVWYLSERTGMTWLFRLPMNKGAPRRTHRTAEGLNS